MTPTAAPRRRTARRRVAALAAVRFAGPLGPLGGDRRLLAAGRHAAELLGERVHRGVAAAGPSLMDGDSTESQPGKNWQTPAPSAVGNCSAAGDWRTVSPCSAAHRRGNRSAVRVSGAASAKSWPQLFLCAATSSAALRWSDRRRVTCDRWRRRPQGPRWRNAGLVRRETAKPLGRRHGRLREGSPRPSRIWRGDGALRNAVKSQPALAKSKQQGDGRIEIGVGSAGSAVTR